MSFNGLDQETHGCAERMRKQHTNNERRLRKGDPQKNRLCGYLWRSTASMSGTYSGTLYVQSARGADLLAADIGGSSDPYFIITYVHVPPPLDRGNANPLGAVTSSRVLVDLVDCR